MLPGFLLGQTPLTSVAAEPRLIATVLGYSLARRVTLPLLPLQITGSWFRVYFVWQVRGILNLNWPCLVFPLTSQVYVKAPATSSLLGQFVAAIGQATGGAVVV